MRSFSLTILAALVCAVAVSAAPSETPAFDVEEVLIDNMKGDITFDKLLMALKCMRDVIGKVIGDGELKSLYEEYKMKAETVVKTDLMKCKDLEGSKLLCVANGLQKIAMIYNEFFMKVATKDKTLVEKIQKMLKEKCVSLNESLAFNIEEVLIDNMKGDITFDKLLMALKCMRDVIGKVIGDGELKSLYEEYKMKAETVVKADLMKCKDLEGSKLLCVANALQKIAMIYNEFFMKVATKDKTLVEKIQKMLKEKCVTMNEFNFLEADTYAPTVRDQFLCSISALGEASMKNGMTDEWKKYEMKFKTHMDAWKKCDMLTEKMKKIFCNIKEGAQTFGLFFKYTKSIAGHPNFQKFAKDFNMLVKQKCMA